MENSCMSKSTVRYKIPKPDYKIARRDDPDFENNYQKAFFYIHYEVSTKDLRKETIAYIKKHTDYNYKDLTILADSAFSSIGKFAYLLMYGAELLSDEDDELFAKHLAELFVKAKRAELKKAASSSEEDDKTPEVPNKPNIQDHLCAATAKICGEIEGTIDEFILDPKQFDLVKNDPKLYFIRSGLKATHCRFINQFYSPMLAEIKGALDGEDKQLKEGYSNLNKIELKKLAKYIELVLSAAEHIKASKMTVRKPRQKKPTDIHKLVSKLKFLTAYPELKMVSAKPYTIVGAKELWVYNTKTRKLGRYIAFDDNGLSVKGTSILNFASDSVEKTIRDPAKSLNPIMKAAKRSRVKLFREVKSVEINLKGRTNDYTILLEVVK